MNEETNPVPVQPVIEEKQKRPKAKKLKAAIGPYATPDTYRDKGKDRNIEVTLTPHGIELRLKGMSETYLLPYGAAYQRALSVKTGFNTGPQPGRIKRGEMSLGL